MITQATCDYRRTHGPHGPLYLGKHTHALSEPAQQAALEVLAANDVHTAVQSGNYATPTPVILRAILLCNRGLESRLADGIVVTPSHNPPEDGGFKCNPPNGGPADTDVTEWIQNRANELQQGNSGVKRVGYNSARRVATTCEEEAILPYVRDLAEVVDVEAIRAARLTLAVDPLGEATLHYWEPINSRYGLDTRVVNFSARPGLFLHARRPRRANLRFHGSVWKTEKDGLITDLPAAETTARTGKDPGEHYRDLTAEFGAPFYERIDDPATPEQKEKLRRLSPSAVKESSLAGEPIVGKLTRTPGNDALIGGLKVTTRNGWFAARPSGTENVHKIYAESFDSEGHLNIILDEAQDIVDGALKGESRV